MKEVALFLDIKLNSTPLNKHIVGGIGPLLLKHEESSEFSLNLFTIESMQ